MNSKIFILTITLNDLDGLKKTVNSVDNLQTNLRITHIIKNGNANDNSSYYIKSLKKNQIKRLLIERKDNGIYDAMNQALNFVPTNNLFIFLNSGDKILGNLKINSTSNFYLLNAFILNNKFKKLKKIAVKNSYLNGMPFNHQSLICKKINGMKFNTTFKICADYLFVINWISMDYPSPRMIPNLKETKIIFDDQGISSNKMILRDLEGIRVIFISKGINKALIYCLKRTLFFPKYLIKKIKG